MARHDNLNKDTEVTITNNLYNDKCLGLCTSHVDKGGGGGVVKMSMFVYEGEGEGQGSVYVDKTHISFREY